MQAIQDPNPLRECVLQKPGNAFAARVSHHADLVYPTARRRLGDHHQPEDTTQGGFVIPARKARSLGPGNILPGWLFQTAGRASAKRLQAEARRTRRDKSASQA